MNELELARELARSFGRKAVEKADFVPAKGRPRRRFTRNKAVQAVRLYKVGGCWEPGEREVVISGAIQGVTEGIKARLGE